MNIIEKTIKKYSKVKPKIRVIPFKQTKSDKKTAKLLEKIIIRNWGCIRDRIENEVLRPMTRCFLYGTHRWIGCGKKERHVCRICGWETWIINDPKYYGNF